MAEESKAVRVAREYREQLARNEDEALRRMARYWVKMENELEPQFIALAQQVKELQDAGRSVPPQYIYNLNRYQQMMADIMKEIPEYESQAVSLITHYQEENFILGLDSASAVIRASKPSDAIWNKVGKDAAETMAGFAGNGAPLAELLQRDYGDIGAKITDALVSGIGLGKGAFSVAKDMRDAMGMEYNRSVRIARTEINRAYRIANADQYAASGVVEKVIRLCYKQTACLACLMMDGEECKNGIVDDHPNGKCTSIAVTIGGNYPQWEKGSEWLETLPENDQRRIMGDGRYEMWKKDGISPRKMVTMKPNDIWGGSPTVISEKELRNLYNLTGGNKTLFDVKPVQNVIQQSVAENSSFDRSSVQLSPHGKRLVERFEKSGVKYREVSMFDKPLSEDEIINRLGGGDMTRGSCMSLAYAYAGNKNGMNVLDFRGGESRDIMASSQLYLENLRSNKLKIQAENDDMQGAIKLLGKVMPNKEYIFMAGNHAAIVRKNNDILQYLELQSPSDNGWVPFERELVYKFGVGKTETVKYQIESTLERRFGVKTTAKTTGHCSLTDISLFENDDELRDILGYINTAEDKQMKGSSGTIK